MSSFDKPLNETLFQTGRMFSPLSGLFLILIFCIHPVAWSETRIAILDFELKDLTLIPNTPAEQSRTASIKPLLEQELASAGYQIIGISPATQQTANSGVGYLFEHNEVAAELAKKFTADFVLVGRLHKPSYLFVYLMGHLIRVSDHKLIGRFIIESKGNDKKLTLKAVESLADEIDAKLDQKYTPPSSFRKP